MGATRPASVMVGIKLLVFKAILHHIPREAVDVQMCGCAEYLFGPPITDAGRVAPISGSVLWQRLW